MRNESDVVTEFTMLEKWIKSFEDKNLDGSPENVLPELYQHLKENVFENAHGNTRISFTKTTGIRAVFLIVYLTSLHLFAKSADELNPILNRIAELDKGSNPKEWTKAMFFVGCFICGMNANEVSEIEPMTERE